jgi:hypothetical protein
MTNIPRLRAVLKRNATQSAWRQPLAVVYWHEGVWYMTNIPRLRAVLKRNTECLETALSCGILP